MVPVEHSQLPYFSDEDSIELAEELGCSHFVHRIQSERMPGDNTTFDVAELEAHLSRNSMNLLPRWKEPVALQRPPLDAIECIFFPNTRFGFTFNDEWVASVFTPIWNRNGEGFIPLNLVTENKFKEVEMANYLNQITGVLAQAFQWMGIDEDFPLGQRHPQTGKIQPRRCFTPVFAETCLPSPDGTACKPNIVLVDLSPEGCVPLTASLGWKDAMSFCELTSSDFYHLRLESTADTKAFCIFQHQGDRNWVIQLAIHGKHFSVIVCDRTGSYRVEYKALSPSQFLRVIAGLAFLEPKYLGMDPSLKRCPKPAHQFDTKHFPVKFISVGEDSAVIDDVIPPVMSSGTFVVPALPVKQSPWQIFLCEPSTQRDYQFMYIECGDKKYKVIKEIFRSQALAGRATRVWLVDLGDGSLGIIKDSWASSSNPSEAAFYTNLEIPHSTRLEGQCEVTVTILQKFSKYYTPQLSTPYELMGAFHDVLQGMKYLADRGLAYRDISYRNILLHAVDAKPLPDIEEALELLRKPETSEVLEQLRVLLCCWRGLLIDYDNAASQSDGQVPSQSEDLAKRHSKVYRTGTAPYMAIEILSYENVPHQVAHDIESLFYVFLFVCTFLEEPGTLRLKGGIFNACAEAEYAPIAIWWHGSGSFEELGVIKQGLLHHNFERYILGGTAEYFCDLKPYLSSIKKLLFLRANDTKLSERGRVVANVTCESVMAIFEAALRDEHLIRNHLDILRQAATVTGAKRGSEAIPSADRQMNAGKRPRLVVQTDV